MQKIKLFYWIIALINKLRKSGMKNKIPLHIAVQNNSQEIIDILISNGANKNAKDIFN